MSKIKRYQDWDNEDGLPFSDGVATRESEEGYYVLYSDYAALEQENAKFRELLEEAKNTIRFVLYEFDNSELSVHCVCRNHRTAGILRQWLEGQKELRDSVIDLQNIIVRIYHLASLLDFRGKP